jgi:cobalt-zinc-cadmium resistance protein CzcA
LQFQITELSNNPYLELLRQQIEVSQLQTKLEKERLKPDFKVGITNQSIERNYNQNFVQAGLNFPFLPRHKRHESMPQVSMSKLPKKACL